VHPTDEVRPAADKWHWWHGELDLADVYCNGDSDTHNFVVTMPFKFQFEGDEPMFFVETARTYNILYSYVAFDNTNEPILVYVVS
jgi:hypothetical protein